MLKQMNVQAPEWGDYQAASREAVRQVLEDRMHGLLGNRIAELAANGIQDRRNGAYRRWLLTGLGAIELCVPRTRTMSGAALLQRYARREPAVDRVILACFVAMRYSHNPKISSGMNLADPDPALPRRRISQRTSFWLGMERTLLVLGGTLAPGGLASRSCGFGHAHAPPRLTPPVLGAS